ncbi:unnamed protein product (macronuclear) [Paramecium tetraurelia]|uniref:Cystatin domain-containing protein n=1 Tax=Paramecium tetraurelia TaxID=5888 RepID=A0CPV3_PARTE|nr:uncharacterized protein GSPATT00009212001 [Paramecium tetraurelia]CAK72820.1 unnamed protein product [Paramecium tetraurelia]|eukprot:XP_001440217.1 hypothetical protein (macronuclear) [Paramecium tetraurelia strain d4-2]
MKLFTLFALIFLVTANDIVVIPDNIQKILNQSPEIKKSLIAKKLLGNEKPFERFQDLNQVLDKSDRIKDSIQFIKVAQNTYNTSSSNYTYPNSTYNYTYTNYSQPTSSYVYSNQSNGSNSTNQTNSTYSNNYYYNTSYPVQNTSVNNYVTSDNQSSTNSTNSASLTCSVGYFLQNNDCLPCMANCAICGSSQGCYSCFSGYSLFTTGCYLDITQNSTSNSSVILDTSTNTNITNYNYNDTSYNTTDNTYDNSTSYNNTNNNYTNDDQTYQNQTYNNQTYHNHSDISRVRERFNQSRVHLKLRDNLNRNGITNLTQIISYYNQSSQQYNKIVLFNEATTGTKQVRNQYYFYQNNSLVVLNQEFDTNGNIVYRSINYDFSIYVQKEQGSLNQHQNKEIYGTIVYGNGNFNATYYKYNDLQGQQNQSYFDMGQQSTGQVNYNRNSSVASVSYNNNTFGYQSSYSSNYDYNQSNEFQNYSNSNSQYENQNNYSRYVNFDQHYSNSSSSYSNNDSSYEYNDEYAYSNGTGYEKENNQESHQQANGYSESVNYNGNKQSYSSNSSSTDYRDSSQDGVYSQNYSLVNQTQFQYNTNSSSNDYQSDWYSYSQSDYSSQYKNIDSTEVSNNDYIYNVSNINGYKSNSNSHSQYGSEYGSSILDSVDAHSVQVTNDNTTVTNVNATLNQYNSTNTNYYGYPQYNSSQASRDVNLTVTENRQQFNQLRGSKKSATGSWSEVNQREFASSNAQIIEEARLAINKKFQPEQEGFQFDSIQSIKEQIVAGINYNIKLRYLDANSKSIIYEVVLYTIPWANQPNQIVSCSRFDQLEI